MAESLDKVDAALHAEADGLLARTGLKDLLSRAGTVHVSGSYALRLMTWRDLDIYLEAPGMTVSEFFALGSRIAELLDPWKMFFTNNRGRLDAKYPPALYWGIRLGDIRKGAWKIDLWAMDSDACRLALENCEQVAARLTPRSRQAILALKAELWNHPAYRDTITSKTIYDAVLDGGVTDLDGFWGFVRCRSGAAIPSAEPLYGLSHLKKNKADGPTREGE
jgi:hypothetical protein